MVDSASTITFINVKTSQDLEKPKLQSTIGVLGAFYQMWDYFLTPVGLFFDTCITRNDTSKSAMLPLHVS